MTFGVRYVAYAPNGTRLGEVRQITRGVASLPFNDVGAAQVEIPVGLVGASHLDSPVELALEVSDGGTWQEPPNARYLMLEWESNPADAIPMRKATLPGYAWLLGKAGVEAPDEPYFPEGSSVGDYSRRFVNANAGTILRTAIDEAKAQGMLPGLAVDFTASVDSAGQAWSRLLPEISYTPGLPILEVLSNLVDQGMVDYRMNGRTLQVYNADSAMNTDRTVGNVVALQLGRDITDAPTKGSVSELLHRAVVRGADGQVWTRTADSIVQAPWGPFQAVVNNAGVTQEATATAVLTSALANGAQQRIEMTRGLRFESSRFLPFTHYSVGDFVFAPNGDGGRERVRVRQLTFERDAQGRARGNVILNDRFTEATVRQTRRMVGIQGGSTISGGSASIPASEVEDRRVPRAPSAFSADSTAFLDDAGRPKAIVHLSWAAVTHAMNNTAISIAHYEVYSRNPAISSTWQYAGTTTATTYDHTPVDAGVAMDFRLVAVAFRTHIRSAPVAITHTTAADTTPPPVPAGLVAHSRLGMIGVEWPGTPAMPRDFDRIEVGISDSANGGFAVFDSLRSAGTAWIGDQPYGETRFFRARSVDFSGNESEWSSAVSATAQPVVDADLVEGILGDEFSNLQDEVTEAKGAAQASQTAVANLENVTLPNLQQSLTTSMSNLDTAQTNARNAAIAELRTVDIQAARDSADAAQAAAEQAIADALAAAGAAEGKGRIIPSATMPAPEPGALWIDTSDGNRAHVVRETVHTDSGGTGGALLVQSVGGGTWTRTDDQGRDGGPGIVRSEAASWGMLVSGVGAMPAGSRVVMEAWIALGGAAATTIAGIVARNANNTSSGSNAIIDLRRGTATGSRALQVRQGSSDRQVGTSLASSAPQRGAWYRVVLDHGLESVTASVYDEADALLGSATSATVYNPANTRIGLSGYHAATYSDITATVYEWVPADDARIQETADAVVTAMARANEAYNRAGAAQDSADGKNTIYRLATEPVPPVGGLTVGDTWFDLGQGRIMTWTGSGWSDHPLGTEALRDFAVTTTKIDSLAVTTAKIGALAVTNAKIANSTITNAKILNVDAAKITTGTLNANRIGVGAISEEKLASGAVTREKIVSGAVNAVLIEDGAVSATKIAAGSISARHLLLTAGNSVDDPTFLAGTPSADDGTPWRSTNPAAVPFWSIREENGSRILRCTGTATQGDTLVNAGRVPVSPGDALRVSGSFRVGGNQLTFGRVEIAYLDAAGTVLSSEPVFTHPVHGDFVSFSELVTVGSIGNATHAALSLTVSPANASNIFEFVNPSLVRAVSASLVVDGSITGSKLVIGTIGAREIADGSIGATLIENGAVTTDKIYAGAVTAAQINASSVGAAVGEFVEISAGQVTTGTLSADRIGANTITGSKLVIGSVGAREIGNGSITATLIQDGAITTGKVAANAITAAKIAALTITASEIATNAVTTAKVNAGAITAVKIGANAVTSEKIQANAVTANEVTALAITSKHTITAATYQTTATASRGLLMNTAGFRAYNASGTQTAFINSSTGSVEVAGSFRTGLGVNQAVLSDGIYAGRPGLQLNTGSGDGLQPVIYSVGTGGGGYPAGSLVLHGREATVNSSGRGSLVIEPGGDFRLAREYGSFAGTGVHVGGRYVDVQGRHRGASNAHITQTITGRVGTTSLLGGQAVSYTITYGSPVPIGTRRVVASGYATAAANVGAASANSQSASGCVLRVANVGTATATFGIDYQGVWI